jgi:hypothetical protein
MAAITTDRIRKSVKLTAEEHRALVKWVNAQPTKVDACIALDLTRPTLDRILAAKSGSPESIEKVLKVLRQDAGTDE